MSETSGVPVTPEAAPAENMLRWQRHEAAQREAATQNRRIVFATLALHGIIQVNVSFNGEGDSGQICAIIGVDVATVSRRSAGPSSVYDACIYFRGFSSQGDGASFEGVYKYAPQDEALHAIADQLTALQRRNFYQLTARITQRGLY